MKFDFMKKWPFNLIIHIIINTTVSIIIYYMWDRRELIPTVEFEIQHNFSLPIPCDSLYKTSVGLLKMYF